MSAPADITEAPDRVEQMLARLAELDLAAAERAHERYMAAEAAQEATEHGRTYQRMARSLRQTLALKAKLKRDREQAAAAPPTKPGGQAVAKRIREVRQAVLRVAWDEADDEETYDWYGLELDQIVAQEVLKDGFAAEPLADHVARLCLTLGYAPETIARWADLPDPPRPPQPIDELDWRGSG